MAEETTDKQNPLDLTKTERIIYAKEQTVEKVKRDAWDMFLLKCPTIADDITSITTNAYNLGFNFVLTCARDCLDDKQFKKLARHVIKMQNKLNHDQEI